MARTKFERTSVPGVQRYATKRGMRYVVRFRTPDGRSTSRANFTTLQAARAWQSDLAVQKRTGTYISPTAGAVTVNELWERYAVAKRTKLRPGPMDKLESRWRVHVGPVWGAYPVGRMTREGVQVWVSRLAERYSASTVHGAVEVLRGILDVAVADHLVATNVAQRLSLPAKRPKTTRRYLAPHEVDAVAQQLSGQERLVFLFLVFTGLRWGEMAALRVGSVDLERRRVSVERAVSWVSTRWVETAPKSSSRRSVPIPPPLAELLKAQIYMQSPHDLVFPASSGGYLRQPRKTTPDSNKRASAWLYRACEQAGVEYVTPHELRHTCASLAVRSGASVLVVQRMLGHASARMTLDVYADLFDDDLDDVASRMSANWPRSRE